jgi:DNA-directed RNA polymerase I, II, and III subunit RPABC2
MADDGVSVYSEDNGSISETESVGLDEGNEKVVTKEGKAAQFLATHHPECRLDYKENVLLNLALEAYPPDHGGDKKHKSVPYLTVFEKTKILGFRANQLAQGGKPFLTQIPPHVTDVLEIAALELEQKRLPFILKRPMPDGSFEYIRLSDLMLL